MLPKPKILVRGTYNLKKCQKRGSRLLRMFLQSPVKNKQKVTETSNMAQYDCHVIF